MTEIEQQLRQTIASHEQIFRQEMKNLAKDLGQDFSAIIEVSVKEELEAQLVPFIQQLKSSKPSSQSHSSLNDLSNQLKKLETRLRSLEQLLKDEGSSTK